MIVLCSVYAILKCTIESLTNEKTEVLRDRINNCFVYYLAKFSA